MVANTQQAISAARHLRPIDWRNVTTLPSIVPITQPRDRPQGVGM
jgi:hypothetical protein